MRLPRPRTVRTKLTLTTVGVIAAVLLLLCVITDFAARQMLTASIDDDLQNRAEDIARFPARRGPEGGRGFGGPGGPDDRGGPNRRVDNFVELRRPNGPPPGSRRRDPAFTPPYIVMLDGTRPPGPPGPETAYDSAGVKQALQGVQGFGYVQRTDGLTRIYTTPVFKNGKVEGAVQTAYPMEDVIRSFDNLRFILLTVVMPVGVALAALASLFVVERLLRPLRRLVNDAENIDSAGEGGRMAVVGQDEFADLAQTLNGMLERVDLSFESQQAALDAQRRFTADASHELKTPLAVIKANTGLLLYTGKLEEMEKETIVAIDDAATRMNRLVRDLLTLARTDDHSLNAHFEPCELEALVARSIQDVPQGSARVKLEIEEPEVVMGIASDLSRVFVNLIDNAIKHSGASEPVEVRVRGSVVEVKDHGHGIAAEHLPHLFDRFYRADASRSSETGGTGLGLAIVRGIVEAHGGTVQVESEVGVGTTFRVTLPERQQGPS